MPESTLSPIFGVVFALAGVALAIGVGLVLYKDKKPEEVSREKTFEIHEARSAEETGF